MRNGFLGSIAALVSGAGLALAQSPPPTGPDVLPPVVVPATGAAHGAAAPVTIPLEALPTAEVPGPIVSEEPGEPGHEPRRRHKLFGKHEGVREAADSPDLPRSAKGGSAQNIIPSEHEVRVAYRFWARGEYLLWWINDGVAPPPLVTTGPPASFGILGQPGVRTLLGGQDIDYGEFHGARATAGLWFDEDAHLGVEVTWMMLFENSQQTNFASNAAGSPVLARPAIDAVTRTSGVQLVSFPGALTGRVGSSTSSELSGVEVNFIGSEWRGKHAWVDLIAGFRYLNLEEELTIDSTATVLPLGTAAFLGQRLGPGNTVSVSDRFQTRNQFFGGTIGLRSEFCYHRFFLNMQGKLSIGNNHEVVIIEGSSSLATPAGGSATVPGGLLAVGSNSRVNSRDEFTLIPELSVNVGAYLCRNIKLFVGYNYMYWSDVVRPGNQPSLIINPSQVPTNLAFGLNVGGPKAPAAIINRSDFWAQGVNFGVEFRY